MPPSPRLFRKGNGNPQLRRNQCPVHVSQLFLNHRTGRGIDVLACVIPNIHVSLCSRVIDPVVRSELAGYTPRVVNVLDFVGNQPLPSAGLLSDLLERRTATLAAADTATLRCQSI